MIELWKTVLKKTVKFSLVEAGVVAILFVINAIIAHTNMQIKWNMIAYIFGVIFIAQFCYFYYEKKKYGTKK